MSCGNVFVKCVWSCSLGWAVSFVCDWGTYHTRIDGCAYCRVLCVLMFGLQIFKITWSSRLKCSCTMTTTFQTILNPWGEHQFHFKSHLHQINPWFSRVLNVKISTNHCSLSAFSFANAHWEEEALSHPLGGQRSSHLSPWGMVSYWATAVLCMVSTVASCMLC